MDVQPRVGEADAEVQGWRVLTTRAKVETIVIDGVFVMYLAFLVKLLLFSRAPGSERSINLIPFASTAHFTFGASPTTARFALSNVIGNIVVFAPLGVCLPLLRRQATLLNNLLLIGAASVAVEIVQGVFALGVSDIDDVILNCTGGTIGILAFKTLAATVRHRAQVRTTIAVLSAIAAPVLFLLLVVVRLRLL